MIRVLHARKSQLREKTFLQFKKCRRHSNQSVNLKPVIPSGNITSFLLINSSLKFPRCDTAKIEGFTNGKFCNCEILKILKLQAWNSENLQQRKSWGSKIIQSSKVRKRLSLENIANFQTRKATRKLRISELWILSFRIPIEFTKFPEVLFYHREIEAAT